MRFLLRGFFKTLRLILGPFMLIWEWLTTPQGVLRPVGLQQAVDARCRELALYQYRTCPFCIKTRREMRRLSLPIELRDAQHNLTHRAALEAEGGRVKVPCLKITDGDGKSEWLYESDQIIAFLEAEFGAVPPAPATA